MSPETIQTIIKAGASFAEALAKMIGSGNDEEVRRLIDVLPDPLRTEVSLRHNDEQTRRALEEVAGAD